MARDLRKTQKVPIGAIDDTWGGTPIRAWMNETSARAAATPMQQISLPFTAPTKRSPLRQFGEQWGKMVAIANGRRGLDTNLGTQPVRVAWKPMPRVGNWNDWGGDWPSFDGAVWAHRRITLTAQEAAQPATLSLGAVDDIDQTFVNGVPLAEQDPSWRATTGLAGGASVGPNEIVVYARDLWGPGGIGAGGVEQLIFGERQYQAARQRLGICAHCRSSRPPPVPPWSIRPGVSTIYNAMVAPLGPLG